MNLHTLSLNWNQHLRAFLRRFPHVDPKGLGAVKNRPDELSKLIAQSHELTQSEAKDELANFILIQSLARTAADYRAHNPAALAAE